MTDTIQPVRGESIARPHPFRARANTAFFESIDWYQHRRLGARKRTLFANPPPRVVELGAGAGASMRYLPPGTHLLAIEPNLHAHDALRRTAARYGIDLEISGARAEATGLASGSADMVICTLVLCSVDDPEAALAEVHRILRPGGRFVFIEHVRSTPGALRTVQRLLRRPWRYVFEGCCLDRDTAAAIEGTGFRNVRIERFRLGGLFVPVWPQISGEAVA